MAKNNSNKKNQSVKNQSANALKYTTYTSEKSGKTIPVVYGFADKEDERIAYIAQIGKDGQSSAVHGRYTQLPIGKGSERVPCVMWGAAECWHDVAKLAAKTVNDIDALTQEGYDALCDLAEKAYQQRKAESEKAKNESKKNETIKPKTQQKKGSTKGKKEQPKKQEPKAKNTPTPKSEEVSTKAKKAPKDIYTKDALMAAFEQVSKTMGLTKENRGTLEKFLKQVIDKAVIDKVA